MESKVFIYATCQGGAIMKFLKESKEFNEKFNVTHQVLSYEMINKKIDFSDQAEYKKGLNEADVFIYQPVQDLYRKNSTNYLKSLLRPDCKLISMPFVYSLFTWPMVPVMKRDYTDEWTDGRGDKLVMVNKEAIDVLIDRGDNRKHILALYDDNLINFYYDERFAQGMYITKSKEEGLDVKVHDFIRDTITKKRLFMYCSHPTSPIFVHISNQILSILGLSPLEDNFPMDFAGITSCNIPLAYPTSSVEFFKFEFTTKEEEVIANKFYKNLVISYLDTCNIS